MTQIYRVMPDGKPLIEMNLNRSGASETLSVEAAAGGDYRLTIRANGSATIIGSFQARLETRPYVSRIKSFRR